MRKIKMDSLIYSSKQFGLWRAIFGSYLVFIYLRVYPYSTELYGRDGAFPDSGFANTYFPRSFFEIDSVDHVHAIVIACVVLSGMILFGAFRRTAALLLWCLVAWLYNRCPASNSPEYSFINWLIFACIFIPVGEDYSFGKKDPEWKMPKLFYWGAWIILALGYCHAGASKLGRNDPAWMDGTAMYYVLVTDNARMAWFGNLFDQIPKFLFIPITYGALSMQLFAPVFIFFKKTRPWWWLISTITHIALLAFVDLGQVSIGMCVFHLFLFDERWLTEKIAHHRQTKTNTKSGSVGRNQA